MHMLHANATYHTPHALATAQANLDPKHRDRMAYVRVCSGMFTKGLKVKHSRLKGTEITISQAQAMLGNDRSSLEEGVGVYPGDIIGIPNQQVGQAACPPATTKSACAALLSPR